MRVRSVNVKKTKSSKKNRPENYHVHDSLMGPANVGDGYVLEVQIPLSGEEGNFVLGQMDRVGEASNSGSDAW